MPRSIRASAMSSRRHLTFALGVAISLALAATAALSLAYTPRDPLAMAGAARLEGPSRTHPFGTDQYGRDVLSRVMAGAPTSIALGGIPLGIRAPAGGGVRPPHRRDRRLAARGAHPAGGPRRGG